MAEIRPFRALRFSERAGDAAQLICPPYDIISEEQRRAYLARNPHNIVRLELPRDGADPYAQAGEALREWKRDGILSRDGEPALYVYEIIFTADGQPRRVAGIIGQVKLEEFSKGVILPHEETLSKAKADRFRLMEATRSNFSCIYALYNDDTPEGRLDLGGLAAKGALLNDVTDGDGLRHRLWAVTDPAATAEVGRRMAETKLYIADGHHRYETALAYRDARRAEGAREGAPWDYVMMMMVEMSHPGLVVFPTHRLVRELPSFDAAALLDACAPWFDIARGLTPAAAADWLRAAYDAGRHAFVFYAGGGNAALLTLRDASVMDELLPGLSPASRSLDVTVLHALILERLLGIDRENLANQRSLAYTRDPGEAYRGVDSGEFQCAFLLNPTRVSEIRDVAAAGEKMPQKSTYFYPKLITGLVMNELD